MTGITMLSRAWRIAGSYLTSIGILPPKDSNAAGDLNAREKMTCNIVRVQDGLAK